VAARKQRAEKPTDASVMRHHRAAWKVERTGWAVMALLLLGALLGVFGDGPLSRASAGSPASLSAEYDWLQRASAPTAYKFDVHPSLVRDGTLRLRFDQRLIDAILIDSIVPEPEATRAGPGYTEFEFDIAPEGKSARVTFHYRPDTFGHRTGRITVAGAPHVTIDQYIYP
jgi:hypothetical protein